jgi:hypothetical protein
MQERIASAIFVASLFADAIRSYRYLDLRRMQTELFKQRIIPSRIRVTGGQ